ncbi:DUF2239 family protein [Dyella dinghuensis]|uniref:DUF2239 family protein n=1 Tax=Dyella dinghuensis TaxID=1920169 RepID=A0A3S0S5W8_9GAMM|nr:DUF2239 family protein [Dyella dinghuensis]RUL66721.1 DUF2239 family protein [Dyella dinghuensis]
MNPVLAHTYSSFQGHRLIKSGPLAAVALAVKHAVEAGSNDPVLIFDDRTGRSIDIDTRGTDADVLARFATNDAFDGADDAKPDATESRGRGRPKLGVIAREVTLLPRHWEWLAAQPGGSSVALRKLVDEARRTNSERDGTRAAQERAYYFMSAMAGDMPGFEEASRALFANDTSTFNERIAAWPVDVRTHAAWLAYCDNA